MKFKTAAALGASWLALAGAAAAQTAAPAASADDRDARIHALEDRLEELQSQLNDLKESTASDTADVRRIQSDAVQVTLANGRPTFATPDGNFKTAIRGIFQYDVADYEQDEHRPAGAAAFGLGDLGSGANFRRARIGFEGTVYHDWNYALTYEAGGSGVEAAGLQQAWLEYAGWKPWGLTAPVRFRIGAFAVENTLEGGTNNSEQLFLERPSIAEINRAAFGGDGRSAVGVYANGDRLNVSAILVGGLIGNTDYSSSTAVYDDQTGFVGRIDGLVLRSQNAGLHVGVNYSTILQSADKYGAGANSVRFRDRPELRVDDSEGTNATTSGTNGGSARLIDTGDLTANSAQSYGLELGGQWKNLLLVGEYTKIEVDRSGTTPDPDFSGWYVQGAWTITGEQHKWNAVNGGFAGVRPTNAFDLSQHHWGAWEIAARYSTVDLNWNEGRVGFAAPTGGVRGGQQDITTIGLNWYPNNVVRFMLDLQDVSVDRIGNPTAGPVNVQVGQDYQAIALRSQVSF